MCGSGRRSSGRVRRTGHDPEKWGPVFGFRSCPNKKEKPRRGAGGLSASGLICAWPPRLRTKKSAGETPDYGVRSMSGKKIFAPFCTRLVAAGRASLPAVRLRTYAAALCPDGDGLKPLPDHIGRAAVAGSCHGAIRPAVTASKKSIAAAVDATAQVLAKSTGVPSHAIPDGNLPGRLRPQ